MISIEIAPIPDALASWTTWRGWDKEKEKEKEGMENIDRDDVSFKCYIQKERDRLR